MTNQGNVRPYGMGQDQYNAYVAAMDEAGVTKTRIVQTIGDAPASAGTHLKDGVDQYNHDYTCATDIHITDLNEDQIHKVLLALARHGFCGWWRHTGSFATNQHCHFVYAGYAMKASLQNQVHDFLAFKNGLAGHAIDIWWQSNLQSSVAQNIRTAFLAHNPPTPKLEWHHEEEQEEIPPSNDDVLTANGQKSTCQKRVMICAIYDADENLLVCESNRCDPPNGACLQLNVVQTSDCSGNPCNWEHAEARAIKALQKLPWCTEKAVKAVVYGHDAICPDCAKILADAGITETEIVSTGFGSGPKVIAITLEQMAREFCADSRAGKGTMNYIARFESILNAKGE